MVAGLDDTTPARLLSIMAELDAWEEGQGPMDPLEALKAAAFARRGKPRITQAAATTARKSRRKGRARTIQP
jgi:hypothetical protein